MSLPELPIDRLLPEIARRVEDRRSAVIVAAPGAGKTTRVPPALLDAGVAGEREMIVLEPRRVAAVAAAARMSEERGATLGEEIGYQVRYDSKAGRRTRIIAMTDGVFLRRLHDDPLLERVGAVVFDEFHERSLNVDLALAMTRRAQSLVRDDLKIVVMSATLAAEPVAAFLGGCPIVKVPGRQFPVEVRYLKHARSEPPPRAAASAAREALAETSGHVLVFLPGYEEIRRAAEELSSLGDAIDVLPLYGDLPLEKQRAVLAPSARRKIVLATNVAETSLTIDGVTAVVDVGLARRMEFDAEHGLNRLALGRVSRAAADQRAGRAGRTAPGVCYRLWTEREQQGLAERETPEIARVDLSGALLQLLTWGETDFDQFEWFESPPVESMAHAWSLLARLGAVVGGKITPLGERMARLPVHPRLARLLLAGQEFGVAREAALAAALLSERDPFRRESRALDSAGPAHWSRSDVADRVAMLEEFSVGRSTSAALNRHAARQTLKASEQLLRLVDRTEAAVEANASIDRAEGLERAIFAAFADRLARRREPKGRRGVMVGARGVRLADESAVVEPELFVCVDAATTSGADLLVRQASAVERDWIPAEQTETTIDLEFDAKRERVVALRRARFGDLVLDEAPVATPRDEATAALLAREAVARLERSAWLSDDARSLIARMEFLRKWPPELDWPAIDDEHLDALLPRLCLGSVSFDELRAAQAASILKGLLDGRQLAALDRDAPETLLVPSGRRIALVYEPGKPPVLAVRIQEVFGWRETPRLASGKAPITLQLLAPSNRVEQTTSDLASFWKNTYPQVRKELKRRYPKHSWPEDPLTAEAESRPKRK